MKKSELIFSAILVPLDYFMLITAAVATYFLRVSPYVSSIRPALFTENLPFFEYLLLALMISPLWIIFFAIVGLYNLKTSRHLVEEFFKIIIGSSAGLTAVIIYMFFRGELFNSRFIILIAWISGICCVTSSRFFLKKFRHWLARNSDIGIRRMFIIGQNDITKKIAASASDNFYKIVGYSSDVDFGFLEKSARDLKIDDILLSDIDFPKEKIMKLMYFCEDNYIALKFVPNIFQILTSNTEMANFAGYPVVELKRTALDGWGQIIKRIIDVVGAIFGIIALMPLFGFVFLFIKLDSEGPVFVKLKRVGYGRVFDLYKFRSMIKNAESLKKDLAVFNERKGSPLFKMKNDPRVTRVGRILRKTRFDELPQLFNVLRGEMSLVGPRPHEPAEVAEYQRHHKKVLAIKPGITGLAQISGSSDLPFDEEVRLDTFYVENWTLAKDIKILIRTLRVIFFDKSAC
ncbi:MAG: hypothetical protein US76_02865 [Parcubacteria group bacterium GW2011_GWA2_38_13b]|nr:MAG: hypothetical protein US76_02865 [Parcubacteria group bacterium GW2011_GWA2_38_13b]